METFITLPSPSGGFNVTFPPSLLQATSLESHQKWPSRRGWISKLHVISKLHYKYHSTELKQWVRCGFSDPTIFSSCRNNARISVQLSNYPVRRCHSSFREFLLWPDLEVSAPQGGGGELSDYEKLRVARMEANTEFLRGLGLA